MSGICTLVNQAKPGTRVIVSANELLRHLREETKLPIEVKSYARVKNKQVWFKKIPFMDLSNTVCCIQ